MDKGTVACLFENFLSKRYLVASISVTVISKKERKRSGTSGEVAALYSSLPMLLLVVWTLTMLNTL